jgi:hypothetical protein
MQIMTVCMEGEDKSLRSEHWTDRYAGIQIRVYIKIKIFPSKTIVDLWCTVRIGFKISFFSYSGAYKRRMIRKDRLDLDIALVSGHLEHRSTVY